MVALQSLVLSPTEGERVTAGPFTIVSRVQGPQSGGLFELYELSLGPATIDYHVHHTMDETLTVLEVGIEFTVAGKTLLRPAGSVAFVPRGVHHGFTNPGPDTARVLILFTPAQNQHEYFRVLERLFAAPTLDTAALKAAQKQYDQELVPLEQ
ncbi:MAG: cupin domain-containing protein [Isosphaeraceae bacterium]|nr:cupin domain-containing protein [Isosphaeraceae bacterium]